MGGYSMSITCWNVQLSIIRTVTNRSALDYHYSPKNRSAISNMTWIGLVSLSLIEYGYVIDVAPNIVHFFKLKIFWEVVTSEWTQKSRASWAGRVLVWICGSVLKPLEMPIEVQSLSLEAMTMKSGNKNQRKQNQCYSTNSIVFLFLQSLTSKM